MLAGEHAQPETRIGGLNPIFVVCIGARAASSRDDVGGFFAEYDGSAAELLKAFNQLKTRNRTGGGLPALATTYNYDDNGNTTSEVVTSPAATTSYTWDRDNRLRVVTPPSPAIVTQYAYEAKGLRIERVDAAGTTRYLLDGQRVLADLDAANAAMARYLSNPQATNDVISFERSGATYYPLTDSLGSWYAVIDSTGAVVHCNRSRSLTACGSRSAS